MNGKLQWPRSYMRRQQDILEEVTLVNPLQEALRVAVSLRRVQHLTVLYRHDDYDQQYWVPPIPFGCVPTAPHLTRLTCGPGVSIGNELKEKRIKK